MKSKPRTVRYKGYIFTLVVALNSWVVSKAIGTPHLRTCATMGDARAAIDRLVIQDRARARLPAESFGCEITPTGTPRTLRDVLLHEEGGGQ